MTKQKLLANVSAVISLLLILLLTAISSRIYFRSEISYSIIKDFTPLLIAVAAAYLAYCFQRRQAFLVSLRDLWKEMVDAKNELVEYTHNANPDQPNFRRLIELFQKLLTWSEVYTKMLMKQMNNWDCIRSSPCMTCVGP